MISILTGDALAVLRGMEAGGFHCAITSPPYFSLRDYGVAGQIGLEATFEEWLEKLVAVFEEVRRVLRDDGTCWVNIGDSYSGDYGWKPEDQRTSTLGPKRDGLTSDNSAFMARPKRGESGLRPKNLIGQPWRLAFALRDAGWYLRSEIIWHKPNPMPESVEDRPTKAHEQIFLLSKSPKYFFDMDAIREPHARLWDETNGGSISTGRMIQAGGAMGDLSSHPNGYPLPNPAGRNKRTVWTVPSHAFSEAHFATFPPALIEPCVRAGTSERGCCPECGAAWIRTVKKEFHATQRAVNISNDASSGWNGFPKGRNATETLGFRASCEHGREPVPCRVLDPFGGACTTALVADRLGRDATMIELNPSYVAMGAARLRADCPMFTRVEVTP